VRKVAGVMLIFQGLVLPGGTAHQLFGSYSRPWELYVDLVLMGLIIGSGVCALKRTAWGFALAGAILSVLIPLPLVLLVSPGDVIFVLIAFVPVIFLVASRGEFMVVKHSLPLGFEPEDDDT